MNRDSDWMPRQWMPRQPEGGIERAVLDYLHSLEDEPPEGD